jgi:hypothetical protein
VRDQSFPAASVKVRLFPETRLSRILYRALIGAQGGSVVPARSSTTFPDQPPSFSRRSTRTAGGVSVPVYWQGVDGSPAVNFPEPVQGPANDEEGPTPGSWRARMDAEAAMPRRTRPGRRIEPPRYTRIRRGNAPKARMMPMNHSAYCPTASGEPQ